MILRHLDLSSADRSKRSPFKPVHFVILSSHRALGLPWCRWPEVVPYIISLSKQHPINLLTSTHTRLTALCPGLPRWAGTRKVKPIWILLKQETVSGSGISLAICNSAPRSRQITTPAPHHSVFSGRMPFLPPNQQRQSTEGSALTVGTWQCYC